jgi:hypothetical protein
LVKEEKSAHYRDKCRNDTNLFKRGNYSLLHLLAIVNAAGTEGIPTLKLLDEIGSRATYTQNVIYKAKKAGLIKREPGPSEHGQFAPMINTISDKGSQLLGSHKLLY